MSQTQARFDNALLNARLLPPDLLTNGQKLLSTHCTSRRSRPRR